MIQVISFFTLCASISLNAFATIACPDLTGVFDCKQEDPTYGAMFLKIEQNELPTGETRYVNRYVFKKDGRKYTLEFIANDTGYFNESIGRFAFCRNSLMYTAKDPTILEKAAVNEILPNGNYQNSLGPERKDPYICDRLF